MLFNPSYAQNETKSMRMYFNTYKQSGGTPSFTLTGDVPTGVTATASDFVWANTYEIFWKRNCSDRILANKSSDERSTNASISFSNMKYEVKEVRWNRMNDIFDNSLTEVFRSLRAFGTVESFTGTKIQGSEATWMVLNKDFTFQKDIFPPNKSNNLALPGLRSITMNESNSTVIFGSSRKINDNCRFFLKASDDTGSNDWAFQVTYYEPSLALSGIPSMMFLGQERNFTSGDYSVSHTGAFNFTLESVVSSEPEVIFIDANGKMTAKNVGSSTITVTMKDGNKVITASKIIDVKTLTPQVGVHYYHNNYNRNSINFSELNHTDGDYTFSTPDKMDGDFKCLGVLKSATNNYYKVGAKVIDFPMSAPAYTTVTAPFDFKLTNSQTGLNAFDDFGGEIIITEDYNNLSLITDNSASTGSVYKRWKDFFIGTSQSVANNTTLINNSDKASAVKDKTFHMILMSAGDATLTSKTLTTEFYYKIIPSIITYYSYITFDGNGGTITTTNKTQTIANTNGTGGIVGTTKLNKINVTAPAGYTFKGWNTEADGTGEFYAPEGAFRPSTVETGGEGKGNITLYAVWQPKTYSVALSPNANDVTLPGASEVGKSVVVYATYNEPMPSVTKNGDELVVPYRTGYRFEGFFTGKTDGTMYYDENMQSVRNWDIDRNDQFIYLYAHWTRTYTVTLDHNDGTGISEQVTVVNGEAMPSETTTGDAILTPERRGYIFDGYYEGREDWSQKKYYNADLTSAQSWDKNGSATIYAHWKMKPYTIIFHSNDSENKTASQEISNQYVGIYTSFERDGYTLTGWSYTSTGNVVFHKDQIIPSDDINISEPDRVLHLYAQWDLKNMSVTFNYTDPSTKTTISSKNLDGYKLGSSNNSSLSGTIIETPNSDDYVFAGWFDKNENGSMVYDADGNAVEGSSELPGSYYWKKEGNEFVWNSTNDVNLYANWIRDMVSVDVKVIRDDNYENTDYNHRYVGVSVSGLTDIINLSGTNFSGYITVDGVNFLTSDNPNGTDNLKSVSLDKAPIWNFRLRNQDIDKSIDEYKDLYTEEPLYDIYTVVNGTTYYLGPKTKVVDGKKDVVESALAVYTSKPDFPFIIYGAGYVCYRPLESKIFNHVLSMIDNNTDWEFENTGRNPQYRPIRIITAGSSISSVSNLNAVKVIKEIKKKLTLPEYAYNVGKANVQETDDDLCNGLLYVDMGNAAKVIEVEKFADFKKETSKNCLLFMPSSYEHIASIGNNVVRKEGTGYKSVDNLVVTDKVPFSSPYTFNTGSYKASYSRETSDKWGSMCLPFPVKRSSDMKYYNLYGSDDLRLAFKSDDGTNDIPANKPIACYGSGSSFTLTSNTNAVVPADNASRDYNEVVTAISCDNIRELVEDGKQMTTMEKTWNFKGVRFDTYVYGTEYTGTLPNRAMKSLVYYFSKDKFTYVNSTGRVKFAPFRAYLQAPEGSHAKSFSLLVLDEDGATDITGLIDENAGVADGKIYDLLGRRVKTPVKGHIYIVDGKKKLY